MKRVAAWITRIISHVDDPKVEQEVHDEVLALCQRFPVPGIDS
jgi:glycine/serine hydroxymethyltransferase